MGEQPGRFDQFRYSDEQKPQHYMDEFEQVLLSGEGANPIDPYEMTRIFPPSPTENSKLEQWLMTHPAPEGMPDFSPNYPDPELGQWI